MMMAIRPFDWRDLPVLHRYRNKHAYLNSMLLLTQGELSLFGALVSSISPSIGIFTAVSRDDGSHQPPLIGQAIHLAGAPTAALTFLAPEAALRPGRAAPLIDNLAAQVGARGAFRLLADVDELTPAFEVLRLDNFAIYARQRIWRMKPATHSAALNQSWRAAREVDLISVRSLMNNVQPGLVQQVESFNSDHLRGLVCRKGDALLAYVELRYGTRGIWAQPFVDPNAAQLPRQLAELMQNLPGRGRRPVYLCIRSYQSWLEGAVEELGAEPGPRQAVMVKHLAQPLKQARPFALPARENGHPEISAPAAHMESEQIYVSTQDH